MVRFIPKQFAENSTTSVVFGSHQEQGGNPGDGTISSDPATLQGGTAWPLGWSAATDDFFQLPRGEEMEGLERVLSAAIIQQFKDGLTFWQSEMPVTQYQTIVQYQTGSDLPKLYVNITGTSTSTPPDSDTTNWFMFYDTAQVLANVSLTNSPYTTNRILEIPQNIKLELNSGTLTLKAGSKCYLKTDTTNPSVEVSSDLTTTQTTNGTYFAIYNGSALTTVLTSTYDYSSLPNTYSLPLAVVTVSGGAISSVDQIFNGFGYIGSTVFALPGVKVQIPNGRNEDGTYRVVPYETQNVITKEVTGTGVKDILLYTTGILSQATGEVYLADDGYIHSFDDDDINNGAVIGIVLVATVGKIDSFILRNVDSVANSNASNFSQAGRSYLSGLGMPSRRYIDLTLGANGSTYTAPANGYFSILGASNTSPSQTNPIALYMSCGSITNRTSMIVDNSCGLFIPAKKGQPMYLEYSNFKLTGYSYAFFRFVYAEGEN